MHTICFCPGTWLNKMSRHIAFIGFLNALIICKEIHFSEFDDTERSKNYAPSLPSWMCSPVVAGSDCTELEAMAIPSSDSSTHQMKKEALLEDGQDTFFIFNNPF